LYWGQVVPLHNIFVPPLLSMSKQLFAEPSIIIEFNYSMLVTALTILFIQPLYNIHFFVSYFEIK
jgi:hypothetical protein